MDIIILIIVAILLVMGLVGSFLPFIPGPPISVLAVLIFHYFSSYQLSSSDLILISSFVIIVTFLDYWLQVYGVHKFGGGKKATNGTMIGMLLGLFFPPIGIILGPFIGAYIAIYTDICVRVYRARYT